MQTKQTEKYTLSYPEHLDLDEVRINKHAAKILSEFIQSNLEAHEKVFELTAKLAQAKELAKLEHESDVQNLQNYISELHAELDDLRRATERDRQFAADVANTLSWRITAPLRWVKRIIRKLR